MNKPEDTYKEELEKWAEYLQPLFGDRKDIIEETKTQLSKTTVLKVRFQNPKGGYISHTMELSNKEIDDSKVDLIKNSKEKLYGNLFASLITKGIRKLENE